ncbi:enterotoxin [Bacillus anthracis]|nr:enterotoxin [Bacillus anthracis]
MKKVIGAATATVFGLGAFTTTATAETIVTADVLNVREKPTTESKVVEKVKEGQELKVINTEDGWSKIDLNGKEVFVSSEFTKDVYHVTANLLNVRSDASTESEILGRLKTNDVIESTHQVKDGWLQFEYKGKTAYVNVSFLSSKAPIEKKADEKSKQVSKVQKTVKAKEEEKTQKVAKPKEEEKAREIAKTKEEERAREIAKAKEEERAKEVSKNNIQSAKRELTVVATAYTADPSENGTYGGRVLTAMGHDLTANPNMRIIAVDPKVIPLGSKVWVEGYGEAIAGDTGSAIKGNRIDVLMGSKSKAMNWGRQTVKVKIL